MAFLKISVFGAHKIFIDDSAPFVAFRSARLSPAILTYIIETAMIDKRVPSLTDIEALFWDGEALNTDRAYKEVNALMGGKVKLRDCIEIDGNNIIVKTIERTIEIESARFLQLSKSRRFVDLRAAYDMFRYGAYLQGIKRLSNVYQQYLDDKRMRYQANYATVRSKLLKFYARRGNRDETIAIANEILAEDSLNIEAVEHKIRILARYGERSKAFEVFDAYLANLATEEAGIGSEIDELQELVEDIRSGDFDASLIRGVEHLRSFIINESAPAYLRDEIVGRKREMDAINESFQRNRCVILHGIGGVGKTTLSRAFVSQLYDASSDNTIIWVNGSRYLQASSISGLLLHPFNIVDDDLEPAEVRAELNNEAVKLVVLDDIATPQIIEHTLNLLPDDAYLIVTTREYSRVRDSRPLGIDTLTPPASVALLKRQIENEADFIPDAELLQLCAVFYHLPLGVEIAGGNLPLFDYSPAALIAEMGPDILDLTPADGRDISINRIFEITYSRLTGEEKRILDAFGILATPQASLELLGYVTETPINRAVVLGLRKKNLLKGEGAFYRLHPIIHEFVKGKRTHHTTDGMFAIQKYLEANFEDRHKIEREYENILGATISAASEQAHELLVRIVHMLAVDSGYLESIGFSEQWLGLLESAATSAEVIDDLTAAHFLYSKLGNAYSQYYQQLAHGSAAYEKALAFARSINNDSRVAILLTVLGTSHFQQDIEDPDRYYEMAYDIASACDDGHTMAFVLSHRSFYAFSKNPPDYDACRRHADDAVRIAKRFGMSDTYWISLQNRANAERMLKLYATAMETMNEAHSVALDEGNVVWQAMAMFGKGEIYHFAQQRVCAQEHFERALRLYRQVHAPHHLALLIQFMQGENYNIPDPGHEGDTIQC